MNPVFAKLPIKGKKTYYVLTELKNEGKDGFDLLLTDGEKCWNGLSNIQFNPRTVDMLFDLS